MNNTTIRIEGTGSYLPKKIVTNDELATFMETSDEWIRSRTGIGERRIAVEESTTDMAVEAARKALENAKIQAKDIELILVATITSDCVTPSTACMVQAAIGAKKATAFDINGACSGFVFALNTAYAYISSGIVKNALLIGVETLSKIVDWEDRGTSVLFGDGAGAAVVTASRVGLLSLDQGSDGAAGGVLTCPGRAKNNLFARQEQSSDVLSMDGQAVYRFAVSTAPASIIRTLEQAGKEPGDIDHYFLHQANIRIIQSVAKRLGESVDKFPISLDHCGNISAASIPILLDEQNRQGKLIPGELIVLCGFGAGLTWGTALLEW